MQDINRLKKILAAKQSMVDSLRTRLAKRVGTAQAELYDVVVSELLKGLKLNADGTIAATIQNIQAVDKIAAIWQGFQGRVIMPLVTDMASGYTVIGVLNRKYFIEVFGAEMTKEAAGRIFASVATRMRAAIGVDASGALTDKGFLSRFVSDVALREDMRDFILKGVTGQVKFSELVTGSRELITGAQDKEGKLERYYRQYAYDTYQQYDASYAAGVAQEAGLEHFIYQGGLIDDSRLFCREHNNHVYTTGDAALWPEWTPSKCVNVDPGNVKDPDEVPGYIRDFPNYSPLRDRGGFNCRHYLGYISAGMAKALQEDGE